MGNRRGNCVCEAVLRWFLPLRCHNLRIFYEYQESDRILIDHTAFCEDSKAKKDVLQSCYLWSSDFPELPSSTDPTDHNCSKRHCSKLEAVQKHCGCDVPPDQSLENMERCWTYTPQKLSNICWPASVSNHSSATPLRGVVHQRCSFSREFSTTNFGLFLGSRPKHRFIILHRAFAIALTFVVNSLTESCFEHLSS